MPPPGWSSPGWSAASCVPAGSAPVPVPPFAVAPPSSPAADAELRAPVVAARAAAEVAGVVDARRRPCRRHHVGAVRLALGRRADAPGSVPVSSGSVTCGREFGSGAGSSTPGSSARILALAAAARRGRVLDARRRRAGCPDPARARRLALVAPAGRVLAPAVHGSSVVGSPVRGLVGRAARRSRARPVAGSSVAGGSSVPAARVGSSVAGSSVAGSSVAGSSRSAESSSPPPRTGSSTGGAVSARVDGSPLLASAFVSGLLDPPASSTTAIVKKTATRRPRTSREDPRLMTQDVGGGHASYVG